MGTATYTQAGTGTSQTAAVSFGGGTFPPSAQLNVTQEYDEPVGLRRKFYSLACRPSGDLKQLTFGGDKSSAPPHLQVQKL